jgi:outer membrane lipase/esterase
MPRIRHLSSAVAVALAFSGAAQAQSFDNYFVFGDSLSDAGNVAALLSLPAGNSFTTNPDPVYAQIIGATYGFNITNFSPFIAGSTGTDYAVGGACASPDSTTFHCVNDPSGAGLFSVTGQLNGYLTANGGHADPHALYSVWSGANDIFTAVGNPATAAANTVIAANVTVGLIGALQTAGAKYIIVFNLPDLGLTPANVGTPSQNGASQITIAYNTTFNTDLASLGDGIIPVDVYGLVNDVIANPALYGFTDVTHPACGVGASSVACGPAGSGLPFTYAPGTNDTFLFADGVHPSGAGHRLLAQAVIAELAAPTQISMMGQAALKSYEDHSRTIDEQIFEGRGSDRADDSTLGFANLQYSNIGYDATANTPQTDLNQTSLTAGGDYRGNEHYSLGGAISLSSQQIDAGGARIDGRAVLFSLYGVWNVGNAYFDAVASGGSDNFDVHRHIQLLSADRVENGNTNASQNAFALGAGYLFGDGGIKHGPFIDVTWQKADINNFAETGIASTQMTFGSFTRDSLVGRIGYQLRGTANNWHPYARLAYNDESRNDPSQVTAGMVNMNGHFTLPGLVPTNNWWTADLGVSFDVNDSTTASVNYSGLFGDSLQNRNTINFGVNMKF